MIKVFVVDLCRLLEYEVTESTSLSEVQQWVARDSGVMVDDQRPLLPRGQPPDPTRPAIQCWAPPVSRATFAMVCYTYSLLLVSVGLFCLFVFVISSAHQGTSIYSVFLCRYVSAI